MYLTVTCAVALFKCYVSDCDVCSGSVEQIKAVQNPVGGTVSVH